MVKLELVLKGIKRCLKAKSCLKAKVSSHKLNFHQPLWLQVHVYTLNTSKSVPLV